jgi:hypothetical protein
MTGKAMPNCHKCIARCAAHSLHCEAQVMAGRDIIDCKTFEPDTKGR